MPTLPPSPHPAEPHQARDVAESFGIDPERYDRTRPGYPQDLIQRLIAVSPGREVLDIGCGTGIAARQFQAAGCRVVGVDVDSRMAAFARRRGLEVEVAKFEDWDPAGRLFDTAISGQAWHWIDPVAGAAKAAEVLRPGGRIGVFRNDPQLPPELTKAFGDVYASELPDLPLNPYRRRPHSAPAGGGLSGTAIEALRQTRGFEDPEQWTFEWERPYTKHEWLDELPTTGLLTRLPPATLAKLLEGIGAAIDAVVGGSFTARYSTVAVTARRIA